MKKSTVALLSIFVNSLAIAQITDTGGDVGIGTTSPADKLDVNGSIIISNGYNLSWGGTYGAGIPTIAGSTGNGILFYPSGSTIGAAMKIDLLGKVGIGTSSPSTLLEVQHSSIVGDEVGSFKLKSATAGQFMYMGYDDIYSAGYIQSVKPGTTQQNILLAPAGGNVGIGATIPSQRLHVNGNARITGAIFDAANSPGSAGQVLTSTETGTTWSNVVGSGSQVSIERTEVNNISYTTIATVTGASLGSSIKMAIKGTSNGCVIDAVYNIVVNHHQDIMVTSIGGSYTFPTLRVVSDNNAGFAIEVKSNCVNPLTLFCYLYPLSGEIITPAISHAYSSTSYEHYTPSGYKAGGINGVIPIGKAVFNNVGIGTDYPTAKLHVSGGDILINNGNYFRQLLANGTTSKAILGVNSENVTELHSAANGILFKNGGNNEKMRMDNLGNLGIGTEAPAYKLDVNGTFHVATGNGSKIDLGSWGHTFSFTDGTADRIRFMTWKANPSGSNLARIVLLDEDETTLKVQIGSSGDSYFNGGKVGVGTAAPTAKLHVSGGHTDSQFLLHSLGGHSVELEADLALWASEPGLTYSGAGIGNNIINKVGGINRISTARGGSYMRLLDGNILMHVVKNDGTDIEAISIDNKGYIGIGTNNPISKLAVNGSIRANEVRVLADISVPDYVFAEDYQLRTLSETRDYIKENKHLPEIPSAAEIGVDGFDLGEMNMKLLKKVEELTLYLIEQNKMNVEQSAALQNQNKEIEILKKKIENLK